MKVLVVSQPASDGVLQHVTSLIEYLLSKGVSVDLAYSDIGACDQLYPLLTRVESSGGQTLNLRVRNAPGAADIRAGVELLRFIRTTQPDVIHAHSSKAGGLVRMLAMRGDLPPVFYTPHAYYRMNNPRDLKARVFHGVERMLGKFGTTIALARSEADFARTHLGVRSLRLITNGVDFTRFRPASPREKAELRSEYAIPRDALVVGTLSRLTHQKDPLTMLRAADHAARSFPELYLVQVGSGDLEGEVDAFLANCPLGRRYRRIPFLPDSANIYRTFDFFMLSSIYEGMSLAVLEALATDLPLVLTDAPGNRDLRELDPSHVEWCRPGDAPSQAEAVIRCISRLSAQEKRNHREIAQTHFSLDGAFENLLSLYQSVDKEPVQDSLAAP